MINFTKMHGIGNDFIMINCFKEEIPTNMADLAKKYCRRNFSIGADGIILIIPAKTQNYDYEMVIYNSDGSIAEMCGNGIRCAAIFAKNEKVISSNTHRVLTGKGILITKISGDEVRVNMGRPELDGLKIPSIIAGNPVINYHLEVNNRDFKATLVNMGNPHCVIFLDDDIAKLKIEDYGPLLEKHETFPKKINVEFLNVIDRANINMRVWERGCAETLACGTGACSAAVAGILQDKVDNEVTIHLLGGDLKIEWDGENDIFMTGTTEVSFKGVLEA